MTGLDLARRAVACRGWRWMPGMLTLPWRDEFGDVSHPPWRLRTENWMPFADGHRGAIPDLTDPATRGCLLELAREAWRDVGLYVQGEYSNNAWRWRVRGGKHHGATFNTAVERWQESEELAIIAALEAALERKQ